MERRARASDLGMMRSDWVQVVRGCGFALGP